MTIEVKHAIDVFEAVLLLGAVFIGYMVLMRVWIELQRRKK